MSSNAAFSFVDLFAGIGGFHAALKAFGGECVYAVEKDPAAAAVYERNWGSTALGDIAEDTDGNASPKHDVLCSRLPMPAIHQVRLSARHGRNPRHLVLQHLRDHRVRKPPSCCSRTSETSRGRVIRTSGT